MKFTNLDIGKRLAITFGTVTLLTLALTLVSSWALNNLSSSWEQFHIVTMEKIAAASKGEKVLGDGIHMFKDYVLRGQDYDQKFMADMDAIDQTNASYMNNHEI